MVPLHNVHSLVLNIQKMKSSETVNMNKQMAYQSICRPDIHSSPDQQNKCMEHQSCQLPNSFKHKHEKHVRH